MHPRGDIDIVWPEHVPRSTLGQTVTYEPSRERDGFNEGGYEARIRVRCPNPAHWGCGKSRSLHLMTQRLGPRAAEAFLGAWILRAFDLNQDEHRRPPTLQEMQRYLQDH